MTKTKALLFVLFVLASSAAFADWRVFVLGGGQARDEHRTCMIQARGLPASHALAKIVGDWHFIITEALHVAGPHPKSLAKLPPKTAFNVLWVYRDLSRASGTYQRLESRQPHSRSC